MFHPKFNFVESLTVCYLVPLPGSLGWSELAGRSPTSRHRI